jgi:DNA-binding response OmpR family regulator
MPEEILTLRCRRRDLEAWTAARSPENTKRTSPTAHGTDATRAVRLTDREELTRRQSSVTNDSSSKIYIFDDFELDESLGELRQAGRLIAIEPKVFDVLSYLIRHCDRVVSRDELIKQLWSGQVVIAAVLTRCLAEARKAVRDDGVQQKVIKTHGKYVV